MKHYGDITKLSGWDLPIVDCIIGGSPCQDLSLAGRREGLGGERSGLFLHQVRITKEMRERDRLENGRPGQLCRPRILGWENVPGAFSSNSGRDFQTVLTEIVRIAEPDAPDVPLPDKNRWPKAGCLYDDMGRWSVAWRLHDAQYWGTPQRRKRIALVADFGGLGAAEILFEREGVSWHPQPGEETGEEAPGDSGGGAYPTGKYGGALSFQERAGKPGGGKGILIQDEHVGALSTLNNQHVLAYPPIANTMTERYDGSPDPTKGQGANIVCIPINTMVGTRETDEKRTTFGIGESGDPQFTLSSAHEHAVAYCINKVCTTGDSSAGTLIHEEVSPSLQTDRPHAVCYGISGNDSNAMKSPNPHSGIYEADTARSLDHNGGNPVCNQGGMMVVQTVFENHMQDARHRPMGEVCETVAAHYGTGGNNQPLVVAAGKEERPKAVCIGNGQAHIANHITEEVSQTLNCMHDPMAILYQPDVAHALKGKANCQFREDSETYLQDAQTMLVRRLTPRECERLQGFPDDWSRWGIDEKGRVYELSDSARYKLQGNSIAVGYANRQSGFWMRFVKRISALYDRSATLGSLFDGQGGFPLAWEFYNGKGSALWASEIEKHAIAVTRYRFPEKGEADGKEA